jgi:hypothetical protein
VGIGAIGSASAAAATTAVEKPTQRNVEPTRTSVSRADLRAAIGRAYQKITGQTPSGGLLDTLTAHASLETGSGTAMYNFNFGGIKGHSQTGETAVCRTKEVFNGKEVEVRDGFRAYRSLDEGALDYVRLMRGKFNEAVSRAEAGDINGFAHALKKASYYTADETKYADALQKLSNPSAKAHEGSLSAISKLEASAPPKLTNISLGGGVSSADTMPFADSMELGRVLDAIARHPTVVDDDDDD